MSPKGVCWRAGFSAVPAVFLVPNWYKNYEVPFSTVNSANVLARFCGQISLIGNCSPLTA